MKQSPTAPGNQKAAKARAPAAPAEHRRRAKAAMPPRAVELGILNSFIGFHLRQAQDAAFRAFSRYPGLKRFKPGRFAVMMVIHYNPGITQSVLGRVIARDKSTVTPILQDLQRHGLVQRRQSAHDRRTIKLSLTPAGEAALTRLLKPVHEHDRRLDRIVGAAKPVLLGLLREIADALR